MITVCKINIFQIQIANAFKSNYCIFSFIFKQFAETQKSRKDGQKSMVWNFIKSAVIKHRNNLNN